MVKFKPGDKIKRISEPSPNNNYDAGKLGMYVGNVYTFNCYKDPKHLYVREIDNETFDAWRFELCKEYTIQKLLNKVDAIQSKSKRFSV